MTAITVTTSTIGEKLCVYMHMDPTDNVIKFVGICVIADLMTLKDARSNSLWPSIFEGPGKTVSIAVDSQHDTIMKAADRQRELIQLLRPICNMKGYHMAPHHMMILCHETGERFRTVVECANAHNLSQSALSNHLNRKVGHKTVKGRTYSRVV